MRHPRSRQSEECNKFMKIFFPATVVCFLVLSQGEISWAGLACLSNPCIYGICIDEAPTTFSCYCIDGYTGLLCQTNWDECWSNPCLNGGTCVDGIAQFNCTCPQGFQGELCEQNVDECHSNPCHNNGTCIDGPNGYSCICPSGYMGNFCETDISVCNDTQETRCLNGGLCMEGPGFTFKCTCSPGWSGEFCEETIDECASFPCCNGGVCIDLQSNYTCACPFGFSGRNCEVELEMCGDISPCQNGAVCLVEDWLRICYCVPDFHGDRCQFQYNECLLSPGCKNGGTCIDGVDGYNCSCPQGWFGSFCECQITQDNETVCDHLSPPLITLPTPTVPISIATDVPNPSSFSKPQVPSTKITTPIYYYSLLTECIPVWVLFTMKPPDTTTSISVSTKKTAYPDNWFTQKVVPAQGTYYTKTEEVQTTKPTVTVDKSTLRSGITPTTQKPPITMVSTQTISILEMTTLKTTMETIPTSTTSTTKETLTTSKTIQKTPSTSPLAQTETTTTTSTTAKISPKTTTSTTTSSTTSSVTIPTTTTTTTMTQTTPTTTTTTTMTQTTPTTTTTTTMPQTTPTTTATISTTPVTTSTTTRSTTPTITTSSTLVPTPTTITSTTTQTIPTTTITSTTTQTIPTTTTSSTTTVTTPTTTTTTTQTTPVATTSVTTETTPTTNTTTRTRENSPTTIMSATTQTTPTTIQTFAIRTPSVTKSIGTTTTAEITTTINTSLSTITTTTKGKETISFTTMAPTTPTNETTQTQTAYTEINQPPSINSTQMPLSCRIIPCKNGGTCFHTPKGSKCLCKSNWEGLFCGSKIDIKVAGFSGRSFVSHRLTNTHSIRIDVTARTISPEGIILHSHLGSNIFMTLYLEDGLLKFKFSCGVQTMLLSEVQFHVNNGHNLMTSVHLEFFPPNKNPIHCVATVRINNTLAMTGEQMAKGPHADSGYAWVYIGYVPSRYTYKEEVPTTKGFTGCMQDLQIDKITRGIFKDSFDSDEITTCKSLACLSNPCRSGSTCTERNNIWTCHCPSGFLGRTCEKSVCGNNPCEFGGTCVPFPGSGFICLCPLGKQGIFCEKGVETGYPLFASSIAGLSTFAAYKLPTEIYQDMTLTFKFLPHDRDQISLMVFIGQDGYHGATSDHLAISFIKGYVVLTWNLGSGPRRIFTKQPVASTGRSFHTVQIGKVGQKAWLTVDDQQNVTGKSPGKLTQLNTRSIIYLGGHFSRNFSLLPHDLPLHTGFSGCLFDVELRTGQMLIKIEKTQPIYSRGVGQCGRTLCSEHSCENGGGCIHHGSTFTCLCTEGWFGPTCSLKYNPCDSTRQNCSSGSTCTPLKDGYYCDCPVGKTGKYCEISEELSDVKFKGIRSYIALAVEGSHTLQSCIDLEIRPLSQHGLVLYSGKIEGNSFWSISLQEGTLELRVSPGGNKRRGQILVIKSRRLLTVGKWHKIRAGKYGRRLYLWVDGSISTGTLLPGESVVPSGSIVYLGGAPDLSKLPIGVTGKILTPFYGCIRKFTSQWKKIPLVKANILEGRNLEDCDGSVCGGDVCENGGTCHINDNNEAFCTCLKQYLGKRCEYRLSCKETSCQNGGRCAQEKSLVPECHCPNGWGGPFCESDVAVKAPQFGGNSYILIDRTDSTNVKRRDTINKVDVNFIHLSFTTTGPNGMLLWSSKENKTEFVGIGIQNKKIKIVWAWYEFNTSTVIPTKDVADGAWHDLTVAFDSSNVTISLDKDAIYMSNENYPDYPLGTDGRYFLGGFPEGQNVANQTLGHFTMGFEGCLQKLAWRPEGQISNFSKFIGENIKACETFE